MAYMITEECILCDACVPECPNEAITPGYEIYSIDAERCTECVGYFNEPQCAEVCPIECCEPDPDQIEDEAILLERAKNFHPDQLFDEQRLPSRFRTSY
jgi:ferredoxin